MGRHVLSQITGSFPFIIGFNFNLRREKAEMLVMSLTLLDDLLLKYCGNCSAL